MTAAVAVLVVCTANQCRSVLGAAIVRRALADAGIRAQVRSAGTHALDGIEATPETVQAARRLGLDVTHHRSRRIDDALVARADLICCMERFHVVEIGSNWPDAMDRTFTLKDLARRAGESRRHPAEPVEHWLVRIGSDRRPADLLGSAEDDDVADPTGRAVRHHRRTAQEIAAAVDLVVAGLNGPLHHEARLA